MTAPTRRGGGGRPRARRWGRIFLWTLGWTLFQWWAVIGWPDSLEGSYAALMLLSSATSVGLSAWYLLGRLFPGLGPPAAGRESAGAAAGPDTGAGSRAARRVPSGHEPP